MLKATNRAGEAITSSPLRVKGNQLYINDRLYLL
jgi:hypothetical protein